MYVNTLGKFPLAPMGVLAPGSAHSRPSARPPIDTSGNFSAHIFFGGWVKLAESFSDQLSHQIRELVRAKCKHIPDELWRWQAKIVTTIKKKMKKKKSA